MPRYLLTISYDGTGFSGWQRQPHAPSVQQTIESALFTIGERCQITGAGRTDAGVHAHAQCAHFDTDREWEPRRLLAALNAHLPDTITITDVAHVSSDLHARYSAQRREYRYFIWNAPAAPAYMRNYAWHLRGERDWSAADRAARGMVGTHDFRALCRICDAPENTVRTVHTCRIYRKGALVVLRITATAYLTNMVRLTVSALERISRGKEADTFISSLLASPPTHQQFPPAPPHGLFMWSVTY